MEVLSVANIHYGYLVHHGIKDQKWGERNGPPYPLDYSQMSRKEKRHIRRNLHKIRKAETAKRKEEEEAAKKEKEKQEAILKGDYKYAQKHVDELSNKDIEDLMNRKQRLDRLNSVDDSSGIDISDITKTINNISNLVGAGANLGSNIVRVKNTLGDIDKAFNPKEENKYTLSKINDMYNNPDNYMPSDFEAAKKHIGNLNVVTNFVGGKQNDKIPLYDVLVENSKRSKVAAENARNDERVRKEAEKLQKAISKSRKKLERETKKQYKLEKKELRNAEKRQRELYTNNTWRARPVNSEKVVSFEDYLKSKGR